jgi:hypothetical protein
LRVKTGNAAHLNERQYVLSKDEYRVSKMFLDVQALIFAILPMCLLLPVFLSHGQLIVFIIFILLTVLSVAVIIDLFRPNIIITKESISYRGFFGDFLIASKDITAIVVGPIIRVEGSYVQIKGIDSKGKNKNIQFRNPMDRLGIGNKDSIKYQKSNEIFNIVNEWRNMIHIKTGAET